MSTSLGNSMLLGNNKPFIFTVDTTKSGTPTTHFVMPTVSTGTYNCHIEKEGVLSSLITTYNDAAWDMIFSSPGIYTVKIFGTFNGIRFNNAGDRQKITNISQWGTNFRLGTNQGNYLQGCINLLITAADNLDLTGTTSLASAFRGMTSLVTIPSINSWNFTPVTDLTLTWQGCTLFNQDLNGIDVSNVTLLVSTFANCTNFNGNIGNWNTSNVVSMNATFNAASAFNTSINNWNVSKVTNFRSMFLASGYNKSLNLWNTAAATDMSNMFSNVANQFNQPISNFTTNLVTTFAGMFNGNTNFNQDISTFSIASLTTATSMFSSTSVLSTTNLNKIYDSTTGWPSQGTINNNVSISFGATHYNGANAIAGRAILTSSHSWTITDGGTP